MAKLKLVAAFAGVALFSHRQVLFVFVHCASQDGVVACTRAILMFSRSSKRAHALVVRPLKEFNQNRDAGPRNVSVFLECMRVCVDVCFFVRACVYVFRVSFLLVCLFIFFLKQQQFNNSKLLFQHKLLLPLSATTEDMAEFIKPILRKEPENIILHVGIHDEESYVLYYRNLELYVSLRLRQKKIH